MAIVRSGVAITVAENCHERGGKVKLVLRVQSSDI